jgi:hypothetical protein
LVPFALCAITLVMLAVSVGQDARPLGRLNVTSNTPSVVFEPSVRIDGTTQPGSTLIASVDGHRSTQPVIDGTFSMPIDLRGRGYHWVEVIAAADYGATPIEAAQGYIVVADRVPGAPTVLAVVRTRVPGEYDVLLKISPGAEPVATGGTFRTLPDLGLPTDRRIVRISPTTREPVTFAARGMQVGKATPPIDLAAEAEATKWIGPEADRTESTVAYTVDAGVVTSVRTVSMNPDRPELVPLLEGRVGTAAFLDSVAGRAWMSPRNAPGECPGRPKPQVERTTIDLGDRATITLTELFPGLIRRINAFTDRPEVRLCFPDGFPMFGNEGSLTVAIPTAAFSWVSSEPAAKLSGEVASDVGVNQRTLTWKKVDDDQEVVVRLSRDVASTVALLPTLRLGDVIDDPAAGSLLTKVAFGFVQSIGLLMLLWVASDRHSQRHCAKRPRRAIANILTVSMAIAWLPISSSLLLVNSFQVRLLAEDFSGAVLTAPASAVVGLAVALIAGRLAIFANRRWLHVTRWIPELLIRLLVAAFLSVVMTFALVSFVSVLLIVLTELGLEATQADRLTLVLSLGLYALGLLLYGRWELGHFRPQPGKLRAMRALLVAAGVAMLAAIPFGITTFESSNTLEAQWADVINLILDYSVLIVSANALLAIFAFVPFTLVAFRGKPWERLVNDADQATRGEDSEPPSRWPIAGSETGLELMLLRIGLVVFAGYIIGTAGVFASLPVPLLLAILAFDRVLIPRDYALRLAAIAGSIRRERHGTLLRETLRSEEPQQWTASPAYELAHLNPAAPQRSVLARFAAAVGPSDRVGMNAILAVRAGSLLLLPFVSLYLLQYDYQSLTRYDSYYLQNFAVGIFATVGQWLVISFFFGLMYEYLRGPTGIAKGFHLGLVILILTVPFQLLGIPSGQTTFSAIGLRTLQVIGFTSLLGVAFDTRLLNRAGLLQWTQPRQVAKDLGVLSGIPQLTAAFTVVATAVTGTLVTLMNGQVTEILTRAISPFLPVPTN